MLLDAPELIRKHRGKGALIDTNLLLVYLLGLVSPRQIPLNDRTSNFTQADFNTLVHLIQWLGRIVATPHVLSQVSDLAKLGGKQFGEIRSLFRIVTDKQIDEFYTPSRQLVADPMFNRFGLADTAIAEICRSGVLAVTADLELYAELHYKRRLDAINFNHLRQPRHR